MVLLWCSDRQAQLEKGDAAAQELVNSLQVLELMAAAMAPDLRPLVRTQHGCFTDPDHHVKFHHRLTVVTFR